MVKKLTVGWEFRIEATIDLQILEEDLPLGPNPQGEVNPQTLNLDIVNTSVKASDKIIFPGRPRVRDNY